MNTPTATKGTTCIHTRHVAGCPGCRNYRNIYDRRRRTAIRGGTWAHSTPVNKIRNHITNLREQGMTLAAIARTAGIAENTIYSVVSGVRQTVHGATATAILNITPPPHPSLPVNLVPAIGTGRRVRALVTAGYSLSHQARLLGTHMQQLWEWAHNVQSAVTRTTHNRVADLYTRLEATPGPSTRARNTGTRHGWPPPLAWDPETIDDPNGEPANPDGDTIDEIHIARALDPHDPTRATDLHPVDQAELYRRLVVGDGLTEGQLRYRLRLTQAGVGALRRAYQTRQPTAQLTRAG